MVDPIDYTGGNGFGQGIGLASLYQETKQRQALAEQQQQQQQLDKAFQTDWQEAWSSGDQKKILNLSGKYPSQMKTIRDGIGIRDDQHQKSVNDMANDLAVARQVGTPQAMAQAISKHPEALKSIGATPEEAMQLSLSDPSQFDSLVNAVRLSTMPASEQFDVRDKQTGREIDKGKLAESVRSNQATEANTVRGQDVSASTARRGQDMTASTARRGQDMSMQRSVIANGSSGVRDVQLSDGRTVKISGKLHGAGANAFYEGVDNSGNTVRVPANAISAPASSSANATNFAMKKDMDSISNASTGDLDFMTGMSGGSGNPAMGADYRSRWNGADQRQLYMAAQRIQGRMQNQGIAAARDMGASGINTVAEAKMYFQGMPQVDYSSPEAIQQSVREIQQYTDNYNSQYNVSVGSDPQKTNEPAASQQPTQSGSYSSLWGD